MANNKPATNATPATSQRQATRPAPAVNEVANTAGEVKPLAKSAAPAEEARVRITRNAGPWTAGQLVPESEFRQHDFYQKFLDNGAAVTAQADEEARTAAEQAEANALDQQINELLARRAQIRGYSQETTFVLPEADQSALPNQEQIAAAGAQVLQPTSGGGRLGAVVPVDPNDPDNPNFDITRVPISSQGG